MPGKLPGVGFFVATCFAALAIVSGAGLIFVEYRNHTNQCVQGRGATTGRGAHLGRQLRWSARK